MLAGEAVVAIWNDVTPELRDEFYKWHMHEHMAERVGIPGFVRGRRYIAADQATAPEFFTLYELVSVPVASGQDYANRLNAPTPWTRRVMPGFRATSRALGRVVESRGPGVGAYLLTLRFGLGETGAVGPLMAEVSAAARVAGVHLCEVDAMASAQSTSEMQARSDNRSPPAWFILVEAADADALEELLRDEALTAAGATGITRGTYRLEFLRGKTAWT